MESQSLLQLLQPTKVATAVAAAVSVSPPLLMLPCTPKVCGTPLCCFGGPQSLLQPMLANFTGGTAAAVVSMSAPQLLLP
jgi:hypothetical protein